MSNLYLSEDLLIDVLVRLPLKCLIQFKCVSKSWSALIGSHEFIMKHLNRSILMDPKAYRVIVGSDSTECEESYKLCAADVDSPENFTAAAKELYKLNGGQIKVIGSCNGLLCLRDSEYGVLLCNPWTKRHSRIPFAPIRSHELYPLCTFGFGYDDVHDDYKVVRLVQLLDKSSSTIGYEVEVYSLKSNSWRTIPNFPYQIRNMYEIGVLANSALHWELKEGKSSHIGSIVAIDLRTEEFRLLPLPVIATTYLRVLNGCLCVFSEIYSRDLYMKKTTSVEMWVMKEYGIKASWTKVILELPRSTANISCLNPIAYLESDKQLVLHHYFSKYLMWYDIEKKSVQMVKVPGSESGFCDIYPIVGSLVEPNSCVSKPIIKGTKEEHKRRDVAKKRCRSIENREPKKRVRM